MTGDEKEQLIEQWKETNRLLELLIERIIDLGAFR